MAIILRHTTVIRDGWHNAFTDLAFWQGCYWVSYRKGAGHVSMEGEATISVSSDRERWREVAHLRVPGDNRDPKLVVMGDRMAAMFPTWVGGVSTRHLQQYVAFTDDGYHWTQPQPILEPCWWLWRVVPFGGRYYGAAYSYKDRHTGTDRVYQTDWVVSDDLIHWTRVTQIGTTEMSLGEAGFHFFEDGTVWLISRRARPVHDPAYFAVSKPPYTQWELTQLDRMIHSPVMIAHRGEIYVAGRRGPEAEGDKTFPFEQKWSMGVWRVTPGKVDPVLHIPAAGDCAYPGFIVDPEGRVCLSYYSQHAYHMGVVPEPYRKNAQQRSAGEQLSAADVYFAELDLSDGAVKP